MGQSPPWYVKPVSVGEVDAAFRNPATDTRPWATYSLNYYAMDIALWQDAFLEMPDYGSGVGTSVAILGRALEALRPYISGDSAAEISRSITLISIADHVLVNAIGLPEGIPRRVFAQAQGLIKRYQGKLGALIRYAGDGCQPYHSWGEFGRAMGHWYYSDQIWGCPAKPTDLRPVALAAAALPVDELRWLPAAGRLAALADERRHRGEGMRRKALVKGEPHLWPDPSFDPVKQDPFFSAMMRSLHHQLSRDLLFHPGGPAQLAGPPKPRWDSGRGILWYNGEKVRVVNPRARNVIAVFEAFERAGWPSDIPNPLLQGQGNTNYTVRSINKYLNTIKFHTRNEMILWE